MEGEEEPVVQVPADLLPEIRVGPKLGAGAFGYVFSATDSEGRQCAVKYTRARSPVELSFARREIECLRDAQSCEHVVRLLGAAERGEEVAAVLELLPVRLLAHLTQSSAYSEQQARGILLGVATAVSFLHSHWMAHLDIKERPLADNVMLRSLSPPCAVLIDFGFAVRVDAAAPLQKVLVGTPEFQSPEIVRLQPCDPRSCDVWAVGVLAHMLLAGEAPFSHPNRFLLASMIRKFVALDLGRSAVPPDARPFVAALVAPLETRLTAEQLLGHAWLHHPTDPEPIPGFRDKAELLRRQLQARRLFRIGVAAVLVLGPKPPSKVAVVTGGNRGLGRALVERLVASREYRTVLFSSREQCGDVPAGSLCCVTGDFAEADNVRRFAARVLEEHGRVDVLINNAGEMLHPEQPFLQATAEDMLHSFAVNTVAPVLLMQAFLPVMERQGGGAVVNVSSGQGAMYEMGSGHLAYRCSKAALNVATLVASAEHAGVRINSVCPGFVRTDLTAHLEGEMTEPADAAEQIVWLLADDAPKGGFWRNGEPVYW